MRIEGRKVEKKADEINAERNSHAICPYLLPTEFISSVPLSFYLPPPILLSHLPHSLANSLFNKLYIRSNKNFEAPCAEI